MIYPQWDTRECVAIVGTERKEVLRFLDAWQRAEGGTAKFNPHNTTYRMPGSTAYNRAGVQNYLDEMQGLAAFLLTLRNGYYPRLIAALRNPNGTAEKTVQSARADIARWGTSPTLIARLLSN